MSDPDYTIPVSKGGESSHNSGGEYGYKVLNSGDILVNQYQIVKELGSGGFATTYLAIDSLSTNETKCVIKQLQPRFNSPSIWENAKERLDTEGMVLQWLGKHDQIPQLFNHFQESGQFYLVLEFIDGEEFDKEVQRQLLNEAQVIEFLNDVLEVLDFVHQQGVIHRDIKPSNLIRRNSDGKITLIDFGAVKEIGTTLLQSSQQTWQTQVIGTPGYMSPEQNNGKPLYSSDIYALGKTAIYALTGRSPVEWEQIETNESISWYEKTKISEGLTGIILKMISPKTSERYHAVQEVIQDLKPLLMVGQIIKERYYIMEYLNSEGFISNYIVKDISSSHSPQYFLQKLSPTNPGEEVVEKSYQDLQSTIKQLSRLKNNSQVLSIKDSFRDDKHLYILQDYVIGKNIEQLVSKKTIFSEAEIIKLILDVATVLQFCHSQEVLHGNIKPSSLIYDQEQEKIVLRDFSSVNDLVNLMPNLQTGYVAPEQIAGRLSYGSDIYGLGMTAIYALTKTIPEKLDKNIHTGQILWEEKTQVSAELITVINKMICLDQRRRYRSSGQVIRAVKNLKSQSKFYPWYVYAVTIPLLAGGVLFGLLQWAQSVQRTAILEFYKADIFLQDKQYESAVTYYDAGLKKLFKTTRQVEHFQQVWIKQAKALSQLKRYEDALVTCNQALKYYQSYELWNCRGLALDGLERYAEAITAYDNAIALEREYLWTWNNRGEVYTKLGKTDQAIADFQKAIELDEAQSFIPWNNLGKLYYQQQQYQTAIDAYQKAIAIKPEYLPALIGLGNTYKAIQEYYLALQTYEQVIEINPNSYEAWFSKGLATEAIGQYREARKAYNKALELKENWQAPVEALKRLEK